MRWGRPLFFAACIAAAAEPAAAQRFSKIDGNRLLQICTLRAPAPLRPGLAPPPGRRECEAYVSGVADGIAAGPPRATACIPDGVTTAQLVEVVLKTLRDHPENAERHAGELVVQAYSRAFPCK